MTTAEDAAAAIVKELAVRGDDSPGQFGFASRERVKGVLEASGWTAIEIRPVDLPCSLPAAQLPSYVTRMGPYGRVRNALDDTVRARADSAVLAALDPYIAGDQVRFTSACWLVTGVA